MEFKKVNETGPSVKESYITILKDRLTLIKQSIIAIEDALNYLMEDATEKSD